MKSELTTILSGLLIFSGVLLGETHKVEASCWTKKIAGRPVKVCNPGDKLEDPVDRMVNWLDRVGGSTIELGVCGSRSWQTFIIPDSYDFFYGTGLPSLIPQPNGAINFAPACMEHDNCYDTSCSLKMKKEDCDRQFFVSLHRECDATVPSMDLYYGARKECEGLAPTYYATVRKSGDTAFQNAWKNGGCSENDLYPQENESKGGISSGVVDQSADGISAEVVKNKRQGAILLLLNQYVTTGF